MPQLFHDPSSSFSSSSKIAVMVIDGARFVVSQNEIVSLESVLDMDTGVSGHNSVGRLAFRGEVWEAFCLSKDMQLLADIPFSRKVCVLLKTSQARVGVLCDSVQAIDYAQFGWHPLPECMRTPGSPLVGLALSRDTEMQLQLGFIVTADSLMRYFAERATLASAAEGDGESATPQAPRATDLTR